MEMTNPFWRQNEQSSHTVEVSTMVIATLISIQGTLSDVTIPTKTADVLEWLRKKHLHAMFRACHVRGQATLRRGAKCLSQC